ncbi:MAG: alpha/beta hydrolase [Verrucomicrobiales bacterium]|nr:alpha/beta hydrolase [Verrucomicrobiales bacterium]
MKIFLWICAGLAVVTSTAFSGEVKTYSYGEHSRQKLDVLSPDEAQDLPVVVFIHGGGWIRGDKKIYRFVQRRLEEEGIVSVSANYRLSPEVTFPAFIDDGAAVVAWTKENIAAHGGDPNRIYLMGHSAGAHTVAMLGLDESYLEKVGVERDAIKGVIPIAAPLMLKASQVPQLSFVFGAARDEEMWPLGFIDGNEPPFLLLQGEQDPLVQPIHSKVAKQMIEAKGGSVTAHYFKDHDHMSIIGAFASKFEKKGNIMVPILTMISGK